MRRILAIFLFIIIGLTSIGFYPLYKILQFCIWQEVEGEIQKGIPNEEITILTFKNFEKINWTRDGQEFKYKSQLFDIVKKEITEDQTIYWCVNDEKENTLFESLIGFVNPPQDHKNSPFGNAIKIILKLLSEIHNPDSILTLPSEIRFQKQVFHFYFMHLSVATITDTPPPKLI